MKQVCMMQNTTPGTLDLSIQFEGLKTLYYSEKHQFTSPKKSNKAVLLVLNVVHVENTEKKSLFGI